MQSPTVFSAHQPLQGWEWQGATLETEPPLEFVDTEAALLSFPLQHTEGDEATIQMVQLSPLRACLTAIQPQLSRADPNHLLNLGAQSE